jgi:hypothetical protein
MVVVVAQQLAVMCPARKAQQQSHVRAIDWLQSGLSVMASILAAAIV